MLLASCSACNIFTYWKDNIPNIKKQTRQTDRYMINFGEFPSLSLESPSFVTSVQYVVTL